MGLSLSMAIAILLVMILSVFSTSMLELRFSPHRFSIRGRAHRLSPVDLNSSSIVFTNPLDEFKGASNRVLFNGSGLALGDVDGDGWVDVFFCGIDAPNEL